MRDYIDECELDVVALTETWLGEDETTAVSELCGEDFTFIHQPCGGPRRGGGIGVLFQKTLQLVSRADIDTHASETCRVILHNICIGCTMRVIVVYRPPTSNFHSFLDDVGKVLLIAAAHPTETVVCGASTRDMAFRLALTQLTWSICWGLQASYNMSKDRPTSVATFSILSSRRKRQTLLPLLLNLHL